jgi:hypothetical protein
MSQIEKVTLKVNPIDKQKILQTCLNEILIRQQKTRDICVKEISEIFNNEKFEEMQQKLAALVQTFVKTTEEILSLEDYVSSVASTANTEVVKDLPDLGKDSL